MPLTTEDRLAILDLHARYYLSTDDADVDGFMHCWVESDDIAFESVFGDMHGRAAIRAFEEGHVTTGMAVGKRHFLSNLAVRDGEREGEALATSYMTVIDVTNKPIKIVATGKYADSLLVRTDAGWRFARRKLEVDPGYDA